MSKQLITSCTDSGSKKTIEFEFDGEEFTRNLCQDCIIFIDKSQFGKIISESNGENNLWYTMYLKMVFM